MGAALYGLVASGIGLFNESILAERGFGPDVYYQTLIVTALTALMGNFGGGWLATRMSLPNLLSISLFVLAAATREEAITMGTRLLTEAASRAGLPKWPVHCTAEGDGPPGGAGLTAPPTGVPANDPDPEFNPELGG